VLKDTALERFMGTYKSASGILLPRIERHVMRTLEGARPDDHSLEYMHPSDLVKPDWCGRHDYYRMIGTGVEKESKANPSFRMNNVFAEGHAIHGKYQTWLHEMGVLVGMFQCRECGHRWYDKSPKECQFCQSERIHYRELPMRREQMRVEGHADGAVHLPDDRFLVEIKSIGIRTLAFEAPRLYNQYLDGKKPEDIWFEINRPFASHMRQGQLYLWMSWPVYEKIVFIYESKFHQQVKEFVVSYNRNLIAPILEGVKEVSQCYRAGIEPDRPEWATDAQASICKSCPYRRKCWRMEDASPKATPIVSPRIKRAKPSERRKLALRKASS
jgi:CRISPR/Cas system-associated exonuclease Cas4 (RecB family)/ribosomal protein L37E